jgi:hypothetical protein
MGFEDIGALHLGQNRELCCVWVGVWRGHPLLLKYNFFGLPNQKEDQGVRVNGGGGGREGGSTKKYMPQGQKSWPVSLWRRK